jgi:metal-responsive CopG/Arc/MetJ family transcriptional regulator
MAAKVKRPVNTPSEPKAIRASIGFPVELYKALEDVAREKKVSVARIVRDATEQDVARRWPLRARPLNEAMSTNSGHSR